MGKALITGVGIVLFVYALFDLIATPAREVRFLPKVAWFVVILVPAAGPLLWIFGGAKATGQPPSTPPTTWRRPQAKGPDDDPDYLKGL